IALSILILAAWVGSIFYGIEYNRHRLRSEPPGSVLTIFYVQLCDGVIFGKDYALRFDDAAGENSFIKSLTPNDWANLDIAELLRNRGVAVNRWPTFPLSGALRYSVVAQMKHGLRWPTGGSRSSRPGESSKYVLIPLWMLLLPIAIPTLI